MNISGRGVGRLNRLPRATKELTSAIYDGVAIASVDPLWKRLLEELNAKTAEKVMRPVTVEKGEILFSQGDMGDSLYLVQTGCIEISVYGQCGRRLIVNLMMPGAAFGEIALLDDGPRTASAVGAKRARLLRFSREDFVRLVHSDAEMAFALIRILCSRIRCISSQLEDRSLLALEARLARRLLALSPRVGDEREAFQSVQSDLADSLGASREAINKLLNRFRNFGWIDLSRGAIWIRDEDAISAVINAVPQIPKRIRTALIRRTGEIRVTRHGLSVS